MEALKCNIVNTLNIFCTFELSEKDLLFSFLLLQHPFIWCRLPQGSPISFTHSPTTEKRGTPRLESSSHLIVPNNRTGAVKLWQLGWGKISNNYEWDFKCLTWNTLQSPYHKGEIVWKLPENSSKRNLGGTWQVLMTQHLRIGNEAGHGRDSGRLNIIIDVRMRTGLRRCNSCPLLWDLRDCKSLNPPLFCV